MLPTPRLLLFLLGAAWLVGLGGLHPFFLALAGLYTMGIVAAATADLRLMPGRSQLEIQRSHETRLSLGAENVIGLHLRNRSRFGLRVRVRDESPQLFQASHTFLETQIPPRSESILTYTVQPHARGEYAFGDITARFAGPLGLVVRQLTYPARSEVKVYPNLMEVRKYDLLARKGMLQEMGLRNSRIFGQGTEFERLREYTPDDSYRSINWKATARRGKPIAMEYETDRSQNLILAVDTGRLMAAKANGMSRLDYVVNASLMVAYVAGLRGDRVALLSFSDQVDLFLPPKRGKRWFYQMLEGLYDARPKPCEANHGRALTFLAAKHLRRSLLIMFTDVPDKDAAASLARHLASVSRHHLAVVVAVSDPNVLRLASLSAANSQSLYEKAVAQRLLMERRELVHTLQRMGVPAIEVPAEALTAAAINKYLELKSRVRL